MIKKLDRMKPFDLKTKIVNTLMFSGKKQTGEKILLKFAKGLQKSSSKNFKNLFQVAIINSTPTFKLSEQTVKKGKRKVVRSTPSFIINDSFRIMASLKLMRTSVSKSSESGSFAKNLVVEVLESSLIKSNSVHKKDEIQKQVLANKRYLANFRW